MLCPGNSPCVYAAEVVLEKGVHNEDIVLCTKAQQLVPNIIALSGFVTVGAQVCIPRVSPVPNSAIEISHYNDVFIS